MNHGPPTGNHQDNKLSANLQHGHAAGHRQGLGTTAIIDIDLHHAGASPPAADTAS